MQSLQIPMSIWINLALLVAAAIYVRMRLGASRRDRRSVERAAHPHAAGRAVPTNL